MNAWIGFLCMLWGTNWVVMKLANSVFPPVLFAGYRFALGGLVLLIICLYKRISLPALTDMYWYILCGILQTMYFNIAIQLSLLDLSAGLTSVLTYSMPLWLALLSHYFVRGEKLQLQKLCGIFVGIAGLFVAVNANMGGSGGAALLAVSSGLAWALSTLIMKIKLSRCNQLQFTAWQMLTGAAGLFLYSLCFEKNAEVMWGIMPVIYIALSGIIASALGFVIWSYILSKVEMSKASISLLLVPIVGVLSGYIFLDESLSRRTLYGVLLVLAGIWLVNTPLSKRKRAAARLGTDAKAVLKE